MKKKSLKFKILLVFCGSLLLLTILAIGSLYDLAEQAKSDLLALEKNLVKVEKISKVQTLFGIEMQEWKNLIIRGANPENNLKHSQAFDNAAKELTATSNNLLKDLNQEEDDSLIEFEKQQALLMAKFTETRTKYLSPSQFLPVEADKLTNGANHAVLDDIKILAKKIADDAKASNEATISRMNRTFMIIAALIGIILLLALFSGLYIISQVTSSLNQITSKLLESAGYVKSSSSQMATTSEELSQASSEQSASLQETSTSIEEISSMINSNSENAKKSSVMSEHCLSTAEKGKEVVVNMARAIGDINSSNNGIMEQINVTNTEIENIVHIINEIASKTQVINDIVFQTKLLSFNASVEAARAGEQGKGFAVVAEEVGNLAAMSGKAAQEITAILERSIRTVEAIAKNSKEKISRLIYEGKEKVETGSRIVVECEHVLNDIVTSIATVSKMMNDISSASQEQAQGVYEINKATTQLDQVNQMNTTNAAQSADVANSLSDQAQQLNNLVQSLVHTVQGVGTH